MDPDNTPSSRPAATQGGTVEPATAPRNRAQPGMSNRDRSSNDTHDLQAGLHERTGQSHPPAGRSAGSQSPRLAVAPEQKVVPLPVPGRQQPNAERTAPAAGPTEPAQVDARSARPEARSERAAHVARLETALMDRYLIKRAPVHVGNLTVGHTEYRFRGDSTRVAFTESTFKLATDTNSPSVARSMVDVAEARGWKALRVSGNEDFKRMVWLEATARGVKALGYEPNLGDLDALKRQRDARLVNRIEPVHAEKGSADREGAGTGAKAGAAAPAKGSSRGSGGRKAVLAAIEAVLVAQGVPDKRRELVMAAASEQFALRQRASQAPKVKVYDKAAPSQTAAQRDATQPAPMPTPEAQRLRERNMPAPTR